MERALAACVRRGARLARAMLPSAPEMSIIPLFRAFCVLLGILAAFVVLRTWNSFDASRPSMSRGTTWLHNASGPLRGSKG